MENAYKKILKGIQTAVSQNVNLAEEEFYQKIVRGNFIKNMGYERRDLCIKEYVNAFQKSNLLIMGSVEERWQKGLSAFVRKMREYSCKWGILLHTEGIWLVNLDIIPNTQNGFTNSQVVLEIRYRMNTDQKYFKYFSSENIVGEKRNAYFFKDIIDYRNNGYKGNEKSWPAYESALKRFLDFYAEYKGDYGDEENIYDNIKFPTFVEFVNDRTKCGSLKSARNSFFYIKDFMQARTQNGEFDDPDRVKKSFPNFLPKYEMQDVMIIDKLKIALEFLDGNRHGMRNKTILLTFLAYGMERRKLCALKWENIHFRYRQLEIDKKKYPIPSYLMEMLKKLKEAKAPGKYVFCSSNGEVLSDGAINTILSGIAKADTEDQFYSQLTPANIRRCLAGYLLRHDYPLEKILYLMDIEGYKLGSYISKEEIEKKFWNECKEEDRILCPTGGHPMENFLERLRKPIESQGRKKNDT